MVNPHKIIGSVNAVAFTVNALAESNRSLTATVNAIASYLDLKVRADELSVPNIAQITTKRSENIQAQIEELSSRAKVLQGGGSTPEHSLLQVTEDELADVSQLTDGLLDLALKIDESSALSEKITSKLLTEIRTVSGYYDQLVKTISAVSDSQEKLDTATATAQILNDRSKASTENLDVAVTTMAILCGKVQALVDSTKNESSNVGPILDGLCRQLSTIDSSTLRRTEKVRDDILSAIKEVRSYSKPMADRIRLLESKVSSIGSRTVDLPSVEIDSPKARNRRNR